MEFVFEPGKTYWEIDEATFEMMSDLLDADDLNSILADFVLIDGVYYAEWDAMTQAELDILDEWGIVLGKFNYKKSTQSTSPL